MACLFYSWLYPKRLDKRVVRDRHSVPICSRSESLPSLIHISSKLEKCTERHLHRNESVILQAFQNEPINRSANTQHHVCTSHSARSPVGEGRCREGGMPSVNINFVFKEEAAQLEIS